ncbi:T9SS type A sorting domain-containing protein [bacterium]|nr:T9SS type A sorting domain-containing protein [bacterium]
MKAATIIFLLILTPFLVTAQTTINHNPSLYTVGAEYTNRTVQDAYFIPGAAGNGYWDFTGFTTGAENTFTNVAYSASIPHITDCAVTPNYIPYYHNVTDTTEIEGWGFSYFTTTYIDPLGLYGWYQKTGGTMMWITTFHSSYTHSHTWPINYLDSWVEITSGSGTMAWGIIEVDYTYQDTVYKKADGYGTVVTPIGTFQALRVKRRHTQHTHSDNLFFGFDKTKRDFSYNWFTTEAGVIASFTGPTDSTGGAPDSTFTTGNINLQVYNSEVGIAEVPRTPRAFSAGAYPNPFNSTVYITIESGETDLKQSPEITIFDISGKLVFSATQITRGEQSCYRIPWTPEKNLSAGIYFVRASIGSNFITQKLLYVK